MVIMKSGSHPLAEDPPVPGDMGMSSGGAKGQKGRSIRGAGKRSHSQARKSGDESSIASQNPKSRVGSKMTDKLVYSCAQQCGEGPPIAPPKWKWRIGNRIQNMYFYSPSGKEFRSKSGLDNYLQRFPNGPDPDLFCWRVSEEVMKDGDQRIKTDPPLADLPIKHRRKAYIPERALLM